MAYFIVVVDSFTATPFSGNPAAVAMVDEFPSSDQMQLIAREMNLSETAFVVHRGPNRYDLRWFSPTTEVDLCGHATLACAHVIGGKIVFETKSGSLRCEVLSDGWIAMDFPADPPTSVQRPSWFDMQGVNWFGRGRLFSLIELEHASLVRHYVPDLEMLSKIETPGVVLSARSDREGIDFVSRVFCPRLGINEDPVTGAAHCMLAAYWGEHLLSPELIGEQASVRGGTVKMKRNGDRVVLSGQAVKVATVQLLS